LLFLFALLVSCIYQYIGLPRSAELPPSEDGSVVLRNKNGVLFMAIGIYSELVIRYPATSRMFLLGVKF